MSFNANKNEEHECLEDECCQAAHEMGKKIRRFADSGSRDMKEQIERVEHEIHEHPVQSSIVALGVGVLIGLLLQRR